MTPPPLILAVHFSPGGSYAAAAGAFVVFMGLVTVVGKGKLKWLVMGVDGRTSTSKLQAFLWTAALVFAVLALVFQGQTDINIVPDYLYLLGFPALALLFAKSIVQQKITNQDIVKAAPNTGTPAGTQTSPSGDPHTPARRARDLLGDIINNDAGQPDIADFQYVVFNLVALTYFFIHFFGDPGTLPHIPPTLIALTGASAGTYVGNKLLINQTPVLTSVTPAAAVPNTPITLHGTNLGSGGAIGDGGPIVTTVEFQGTLDAPAPTSVSEIAVIVPTPNVEFDAGEISKTLQVSVVNAAGLQSNTIGFTVNKPAAPAA